MAIATLFIYFVFFQYMHSESHSYNDTMISYIHHSPRPLSISSLHLCSVGKNLPVVPSRESNSGLPYSKQASGLPYSHEISPLAHSNFRRMLLDCVEARLHSFLHFYQMLRKIFPSYILFKEGAVLRKFSRITRFLTVWRLDYTLFYIFSSA